MVGEIVMTQQTPQQVFVTGLPRTRTCWLTALINAHSSLVHGDDRLDDTRTVVAYHELARQCESLEEYHKDMADDTFELIVDCSSCISYKLGSKLVIIDRNHARVSDSLMKLPLFNNLARGDIYVAMEDFKEREKVLQDIAIASGAEVRVVAYERLVQMEVVWELLKFIGITPDAQIISAFQELNIQAQYLNTMTQEEFFASGDKINSMIDLSTLREQVSSGTEESRDAKSQTH